MNELGMEIGSISFKEEEISVKNCGLCLFVKYLFLFSKMTKLYAVDENGKETGWFTIKVCIEYYDSDDEMYKIKYFFPDVKAFEIEKWLLFTKNKEDIINHLLNKIIFDIVDFAIELDKKRIFGETGEFNSGVKKYLKNFKKWRKKLRRNNAYI